MPVGTILGGRPFAEDRLLAVAAAYQAVTDFHLRRPADPVADGPVPTPLDAPGPRAARTRGGTSGTSAAASARPGARSAARGRGGRLMQ